MDLQLGTDHDLILADDGSDLVLVDGGDAIAQSLDIGLQTFVGEWFLDSRIGVPYFQKILGQKPKLNVVKALLRKAIMTTPGVLNISDYVVEFDGPSRRLTVSFTCLGSSGTFPYEKELIL